MKLGRKIKYNKNLKYTTSKTSKNHRFQTNTKYVSIECMGII